MDKISIFHVTTVHSRSDVRIALKECASLSKAGLGRLNLFVADGGGDAPGGDFAVHDLGNPGKSRIRRVLFGNWRLCRILAGREKAIVHFHDPELMIAGLFLKLFGHKVVYDVHENVPLQLLEKHYLPTCLRRGAAAAVQLLERLCSRTFDAFVPATPDIASRFPKEKTALVQNYPRINEFADPSPRDPEGTNPVFIYSGGISRIRGAFEMISALDCLDDDSVRLRLSGKFDPPELAAELQTLHAWKKVDWLGWLSRSRMTGEFSRARAGILLFLPAANHVRAQPNKMFEYMAAGLPVIASDFPLWREIIENAKCGLLVDPMNPEAVAKAMKWILENPRESERMGNRGREAVENRYNWDMEAQKLISLYRKLSVNLSSAENAGN